MRIRRRNPRVLRGVVDIVVPLVLLFALRVLLVGHDEPGGGFAAGLVAAGALAIHEVAYAGRDLRILGRTVPSARLMLGVGIGLAASMAALPLLSGNVLLSSTFWKLHLGFLGDTKVSTVLFFDIGVFLVVVGFARTILEQVTDHVLVDSSATDQEPDEVVDTAPAGTR